MNYHQQGDVLLKEFKGKIPGNRVNTALLHKGESHHHLLKGGSFGIFDDEKEGRFLDVAEATELTHEEHKTISIPAGQYKIEFVQEYDHFLEEARQVID